MPKKISFTNLSRVLLVTSLAALPLFSGCAAIGAAGDGIVFIDGRKMGKKIDVADLKVVATDGGTQKAWTTIRNKTKAPLALEVRAVFRGDQGQPVEPEPGWKQLFVQPNTSVTFDGLSMSRDAKQAFVEIRTGNK